MAQDIRELLKRDQGFSSAKMKEGHEARFLQRLEAALPVRKRATSYAWLKIAASIVVVLSIAGLFIPNAIQLAQLDLEYETLNTELMEVGANEQTVQALIDNLQLRLDLMMKLKSKLNTLKRIADETYQDQQA